MRVSFGSVLFLGVTVSATALAQTAQELAQDISNASAYSNRPGTGRYPAGIQKPGTAIVVTQCLDASGKRVPMANSETIYHATGDASKLIGPCRTPTPPTPATMRLVECEGDQCKPGGGGSGTWLVEGNQGYAQWRYGAIANLAVEVSGDDITIHRTDPAGSYSGGLTAVYRGTRTGSRIDGTVTWTWPGHWSESPSGSWYATIDPNPPTVAEITDMQNTVARVRNRDGSDRLLMEGAIIFLGAALIGAMSADVGSSGESSQGSDVYRGREYNCYASGNCYTEAPNTWHPLEGEPVPHD